MSEIIPDQPQMRITLVRLHCRDGAMRWMNDKIKELTKAGHHSIDWDRDVRRAFTEAHLGTDTVELWLAKLGTLRLGKGNTPTPIELESQFDNIARHVYPAHAAGEAGVDLLLTTQYGNIIAASNKEMFKNIVCTQPHASRRHLQLPLKLGDKWFLTYLQCFCLQNGGRKSAQVFGNDRRRN